MVLQLWLIGTKAACRRKALSSGTPHGVRYAVAIAGMRALLGRVPQRLDLEANLAAFAQRSAFLHAETMAGAPQDLQHVVERLGGQHHVGIGKGHCPA